MIKRLLIAIIGFGAVISIPYLLGKLIYFKTHKIWPYIEYNAFTFYMDGLIFVLIFVLIPLYSIFFIYNRIINPLIIWIINGDRN